jgi:DNA replication protein DnaC
MNDTDTVKTSIIQRYQNFPLLALDEVDRFNKTNWAMEELFQLIDHRLNNSRCTTFIVTNTKITDFPPDFGYMVSRLNEGLILDMGGPDVRPAKGIVMAKSLGI